MVMKHMQDTAFSKVIYDKSKIPEWSNEVGEAIAAMGGGNISDAVSVVGVGKMQDGYSELIRRYSHGDEALIEEQTKAFSAFHFGLEPVLHTVLDSCLFDEVYQRWIKRVFSNKPVEVDF